MARPAQSVAALDKMQQMRATYGFDVPVKVPPQQTLNCLMRRHMLCGKY